MTSVFLGVAICLFAINIAMRYSASILATLRANVKGITIKLSSRVVSSRVSHVIPGAGLSLDIVEDWIIGEARAVLGSYYTSIESGPGEWSDRYLQSVFKDMPAVRVAFLTAEARQETALTVDSRWLIYVINGWSKDQAARRRATAPAIGVYRAACLLAPRIHRKPIIISDDDRTFAEVDEIENLWTGEIDIWQLSLMGIGVTVPIALEEKPDGSTIDDFLRAGVDFDLPNEGVAVDLEAVIDIPQ